jgi:hypothetical protein
LVWRIGKGDKVLIGLDSWIGCNEAHKLLDHLVLELKSKVYQTLTQIAQGTSDKGKYLWLTWRDINLREDDIDTWENYTRNP